MAVRRVLAALLLASSFGPQTTAEQIEGRVLKLSAAVKIVVVPSAGARPLLDCLSKAFSAIPGVAITDQRPEWIVQVTHASIAGRSRDKPGEAIATTVLRPFQAAELIGTFAKPEYRDLTGRILVDLYTVSESQIAIVAPGALPDEMCRRIAADFDREELQKKRKLLEDIESGLDPDG